MNDEIKEAITEEVEQIENLVEHPTTKKNKFVISMIILAVILTSAAFLIFRQRPVLQNNQTTNSNKSYTLSDISAHNMKDSCWTAINGEVFDVTNFISKHKGGDKILAVCGVDGSDLFSGKSPMGRTHSPSATKVIASMKIGTLAK